MLEPKTRSPHHLRGFAEVGDDRVVRAVYGENAKAENRSGQRHRRGNHEGAPIWPPVRYVVAGSSHGPSAPLAHLSVGPIAAAHHGGTPTTSSGYDKVYSPAASRARDGDLHLASMAPAGNIGPHASR